MASLDLPVAESTDSEKVRNAFIKEMEKGRKEQIIMIGKGKKFNNVAICSCSLNKINKLQKQAEKKLVKKVNGSYDENNFTCLVLDV